MIDIQNLKFDEKGLIPAVCQDRTTGEVLMVAYMNRESLEITLEKKLACFYSRSRRCLWLKGETSGNYLHVDSISADCDLDTLVLKVDADGPACHTGADSCFFNPVMEAEKGGEFKMDTLYALLKSRKELMPEGSYTTYLFRKGMDKILKKVGEETTEVIVGAKNSREECLYEIADLAYHVMVLMVEMGITPADIREELKGRHVIDKKVKQETMK